MVALNRLVVPLVLVVACAAFAGCVDALEDAAMAAAEAAASQCSAADEEGEGRAYAGLARGARLTVRGPGVLTLAASLQTLPVGFGAVELRGPDDAVVWSIEAGVGSGGAEGETVITNPPPGTYTVRSEGVPYADYRFVAAVASCGSA